VERAARSYVKKPRFLAGAEYDKIPAPMTSTGELGLAEMRSLKNLTVTRTQVTAAGVKKLQQALHGSKIQASQ